MADDVKARFSVAEAMTYIDSVACTHNSAAAGYRIDDMAVLCHVIACARGWYLDPNTRGPIDRNFGELVALQHGELSEALEAHRKNLPAEHIEGFTGVEEEFADALIRILDTAGAMKLRLGEAFVAKCIYNLTRPDHSLDARAADGGKKF